MEFKLTITKVGWCSLIEPGRGPLQVEYEARGELNYEGDWETHVYITHIWAKVEDIDGIKHTVDIHRWRLLAEWFIDELRERGEAYITQQELADDLWSEWCEKTWKQIKKHS